MPKGRQEWLEQGLWLLAESGDRSLTIDELGARMELTKGSFYHHFHGIQDYKYKLVEFWVQQQVSSIPVLSRKTLRRTEVLDGWVEGQILQEWGVETALRTWGQTDEMVRGLLAKVDSARHMFCELALEAYLSNRERRRLMADILLSMLAGSLDKTSGYSRERVLEMYAEFRRLYGLDQDEFREQQIRLPI